MSKNYSKEILMWKEPVYQKIRKCLDNDVGPIAFSRQDHGCFRTWALVATGILPSGSTSRVNGHGTDPRTEHIEENAWAEEFRLDPEVMVVRQGKQTCSPHCPWKESMLLRGFAAVNSC